MEKPEFKITYNDMEDSCISISGEWDNLLPAEKRRMLRILQRWIYGEWAKAEKDNAKRMQS